MIPSHKLMMPSPAQQQGKICVCILAVTGTESALASSCPATVVGLMKWQLQRYDPVHPPPRPPMASPPPSCYGKERAVFHWSLPSWCRFKNPIWSSASLTTDTVFILIPGSRRQLLSGTRCWEYTSGLVWLEPCRPREYRLINFTAPMKYRSWSKNITEMVKPDP